MRLQLTLLALVSFGTQHNKLCYLLPITKITRRLVMRKTLLTPFFITLAFILFVMSVRATAKETIEFWNGNKTAARQQYELKLLDAALAASRQKYGDYHISEDVTELSASQESAVFRAHQADVFVTVAGNPKLKNEQKIIVTHPLMKGLLGYRLLIVRQQDLNKFAAIQNAASFKQLSMGIPQGWADADLFRHNGYAVVEGGTYATLFDSLAAKKFDYVALGANEIETAFKNRAETYKAFSIEPSKLLYYPFALVFYVNPNRPELATRLRDGLHVIEQSGEAERLFKEATGDIINRLHLLERKIFRLENPILPAEMADFQATLLEPQAN